MLPIVLQSKPRPGQMPNWPQIGKKHSWFKFKSCRSANTLYIHELPEKVYNPWARLQFISLSAVTTTLYAGLGPSDPRTAYNPSSNERNLNRVRATYVDTRWYIGANKSQLPQLPEEGSDFQISRREANYMGPPPKKLKKELANTVDFRPLVFKCGRTTKWTAGRVDGIDALK